MKKILLLAAITFSFNAGAQFPIAEIIFIGAVKSLVSKKAKLVRVQLKASYKVLLNNKIQNE